MSTGDTGQPSPSAPPGIENPGSPTGDWAVILVRVT